VSRKVGDSLSLPQPCSQDCLLVLSVALFLLSLQRLSNSTLVFVMFFSYTSPWIVPSRSAYFICSCKHFSLLREKASPLLQTETK